MLGAPVAFVAIALEEPAHHVTAIVTFLVTASEISIIGSAFWSLLVGAAFMLWLGWGRQRLSHPTQSERDPEGATS